MIDRRKRPFDRFDRLHGGSGRARDHRNLDAEQARGLDFRVGSRTAAVLGDDGVDMMHGEQGELVLEREGTTIENGTEIRKRQRRIDGVDAADEIEMLRRGFRMVRPLAARREKDAAGRCAERFDRLRNAADHAPAIAGLRLPFGPPQGDGCDAGLAGRNGGVGRNPRGEGMRGIDQKIVAAFAQKSCEALGAAEAADPDGNRLCGRFFGSACEREQRIATAPRRKCLGKGTGFGRSAQDENAGPAHV